MPSLHLALASAGAPGAGGGGGGGMSRPDRVSVGEVGREATSALRELRAVAVPTPPWWEQAPRPALEVVPSRQPTLSPSPELVGAEDGRVVDAAARVRVEVLVFVAVGDPTPP